jgi:aryl-alcohol dehydrogenase-like predicted oxidoreductase
MELRPGPYEHLRTERTFDALARFGEVAGRYGVDPATLAFAWLLARPYVTAVVVGPRRPQHLESAVRALELNLSSSEVDELEALFAS